MTPALKPRADAVLRFESHARTHPGARRPVNEDRVLDQPEAGLWAVADGMGGLSSGDVAAARVIEALAAVPPNPSGYTRLSELMLKLETVNAALFGDRMAGAPASGSTVVALLAHEAHYACLWAGDSRAYLLRDGVLAEITHDHSIVQQLVDDGLLSEQNRREHPSAHVITRAIGASRDVEVDRRFGRIEAHDVFLVCSDGLTGCIAEGEILAALSRDHLGQAADELLSMALDRRAPDNVSFVIVKAEMGRLGAG